MCNTVNGTRRVIPWESMTPRQKADHLVYGHGYDQDYYDQQGLTNAQVAAAFITETAPPKGDEDYPWPSTGAFLHGAEHAEGMTHDYPNLDHDHSKTQRHYDTNHQEVSHG